MMSWKGFFMVSVLALKSGLGIVLDGQAVTLLNEIIQESSTNSDCALVMINDTLSFDSSTPDFPMVLMNIRHTETKSFAKIQHSCNSMVVIVHKEQAFKRFLKRNLLLRSEKVIFMGDVEKEYFEDEVFSKFPRSIFITYSQSKEELRAWKQTKVLRPQLALNNNPAFPYDILDFDGYPLVASAFTFLPFTNLDYNAPMKGFEYEIASAISKSLNLNLTVRPPLDGDLWGERKVGDEFIYSGLIGEIKNADVDIGWANLYVSERRMEFMDYTEMYQTDRICFLIAKPDPYPKLLGMIFPFDWHTWIVTLLLIALGGIVMIFLERKPQKQESRFDGASEYFLFPLGMALEQSIMNVIIKDSRDKFRIFVALFALGMFVVSSGYKGGLISFLTVQVQPDPADTFDELLETVVKNDLTPTCCCPEWIDAMKNSLVPSQRKIGERLFDFEGHMRVSFENVTTGPYATIYTRSGLSYGVRQYLLKKNGETKAHIGSECTIQVRIALGLQKNSPFKPSIDNKMKRLREAGLISKWMKDGEESLGIIRAEDRKSARGEEKLTLEDVGGQFLVLLIGLLIGLLALLAEKRHTCNAMKKSFCAIQALVMTVLE